MNWVSVPPITMAIGSLPQPLLLAGPPDRTAARVVTGIMDWQPGALAGRSAPQILGGFLRNHSGTVEAGTQLFKIASVGY